RLHPAARAKRDGHQIADEESPLEKPAGRGERLRGAPVALQSRHPAESQRRGKHAPAARAYQSEDEKRPIRGRRRRRSVRAVAEERLLPRARRAQKISVHACLTASEQTCYF